MRSWMAKNPNDKSSSLRRTWAEIDLDALEHNYHYLRSRIDDHVKLIAVLKADAYGHGAVEVARTLEALGADAFAVAIVDEAVALREAGVKSPIIVFGGALPGDEETVLRYHLIPTVHGLEALSRLSQSARAQGVVAPYHLKVDTGMGRVGVDYRDVGNFLDHAIGLPALRLEGVFTHLASDEDSSDYSALQLNRFRTCLKEFETRDIRVQMIHAAGSAGLLLLQESWFDAVRPGIALYGVNPSSSWNDCELRPVLSFKTIVSLLKNVSAGTPLGYGQSFVTKRDSTIATIPVGYVDGLSFLLSNRGSVIIRDQLAPIVGQITMDMTLVDVTEIPKIRLGDEVILIGESHSVSITSEGIADQIGTIPNEILCNISKRVPRVLISGSSTRAIPVSDS